MIKKERPVITYMSQEINCLSRDNVIAGMHFVQETDEKIQEAMMDKNKNREENEDLER